MTEYKKHFIQILKTKQMTSIEWLIEQLEERGHIIPEHLEETAIEIHKQEIIDAYRVGACEVDNMVEFKADKYYKETFGSKGSDAKDVEKEMFELEQQLDIPSYMRWHNRKPNEPRKTTSEKWKEYQDWLNNKID